MCIKLPGVISLNRIINPYNRQIQSECNFPLCKDVLFPRKYLLCVLSAFQVCVATKNPHPSQQGLTPSSRPDADPPNHRSGVQLKGVSPKPVPAELSTMRGDSPHSQRWKGFAARGLPRSRHPHPHGLCWGGPPGTLMELWMKPCWSRILCVSLLGFKNNRQVGKTGF